MARAMIIYYIIVFKSQKHKKQQDIADRTSAHIIKKDK